MKVYVVGVIVPLNITDFKMVKYSITNQAQRFSASFNKNKLFFPFLTKSMTSIFIFSFHESRHLSTLITSYKAVFFPLTDVIARWLTERLSDRRREHNERMFSS